MDKAEMDAFIARTVQDDLSKASAISEIFTKANDQAVDLDVLRNFLEESGSSGSLDFAVSELTKGYWDGYYVYIGLSVIRGLDSFPQALIDQEADLKRLIDYFQRNKDEIVANGHSTEEFKHKTTRKIPGIPPQPDYITEHITYCYDMPESIGSLYRIQDVWKTTPSQRKGINPANADPIDSHRLKQCRLVITEMKLDILDELLNAFGYRDEKDLLAACSKLIRHHISRPGADYIAYLDNLVVKDERTDAYEPLFRDYIYLWGLFRPLGHFSEEFSIGYFEKQRKIIARLSSPVETYRTKWVYQLSNQDDIEALASLGRYATANIEKSKSAYLSAVRRIRELLEEEGYEEKTVRVRRKDRQEEMIAYVKELVAAAESRIPPKESDNVAFKASPDYQIVYLHGEPYELTTNQAAIIRALHDAIRDGTPVLTEHYLMNDVLKGGHPIEKTFKRRKSSGGWEYIPAWGTVIVKAGRAKYRLNI